MRWLLPKMVKRPIVAALRRWESWSWIRRERPGPMPHHLKQQVLHGYAEDWGLGVFVETGTLAGEMVEAMRRRFQRIYSIELSDELFERAEQRFAAVDNVTILHGDSGDVLGGVVAEIDEPALFWLDGHYSGGITARGASDTPVLKELEHIFGTRRRGDVVLIDDARCFGRESDYPSLRKLSHFVRSRAGDVDIVVEDDIFRISPVN